MALQFAITSEDINTKEIDLVYAHGSKQACMDHLESLFKIDISEQQAKKGFVVADKRYILKEVKPA